MASVQRPLLRIPYTGILTSTPVTPPSANTLRGAVVALQRFLTAPSSTGLPPTTVILTGAGLSVASGLADYRGVNGTYRRNKTYRPLYYHEFVTEHEARKRYWARSFLGWSTLYKASPNGGHHAIGDLGRLGLISSVVTQNVDSFHPKAHPDLTTIELHGYLRATVCTTCRSEYSRVDFQEQLARLNPRWAELLQEALASGALDTEDPIERKFKGLKMNPDGDVDLPDAPYTTFRYPPCPKCLVNPPIRPDGHRHMVQTDDQGAWSLPSTAGVLKPGVVMFGESIAPQIKMQAENAIDEAGRMLILGTSLATYSAWRLAKQAKDRGMPIAVVNMGGVRGEDQLFTNLNPEQSGELGVRVELTTDELLPALVSQLREEIVSHATTLGATSPQPKGSDAFKDMLS